MNRCTRLMVAGGLCACLLPTVATAEVVLDMNSGCASPEAVLQRLQDAYNNTHRKEYEYCLADTFTFTPYVSVPMDFPRVSFENWDRARELDFVRRLFTVGRSVKAAIPTELRDRGSPSMREATWEIEYGLHVDGAFYAGNATVHFRRIEDKWYLAAWTDMTETSIEARRVATSGALRAQFTR